MSEQAVYDRLAALGIAYERHEHPPVATVQEAEAHWRDIAATHAKNLFLRNQKGTRYYLVVLEHSKRADLGALAAQLGGGKLSFASAERLLKHLGLAPGAVSPFGLLNDAGHQVTLVMDRALQHAGRVAFHPNINTATIALDGGDFQRFVASTGHAVRWVDVS